LQAELARVSDVISSILLSYDRLFAIGAVVFGGGLSIGLQRGRSSILAILPLPITLLFVFGNLLVLEQTAQAGYKRFLEERLNQMIQQNLLAWECYLAPRIPHRSLTGRFILPALYYAFLVGTWAISLVTVWRQYPHWRGWTLAALAVSLSVAVISSWESSVVGDRTYGYMIEFFDRAPP
jgi:hypothetical protein